MLTLLIVIVLACTWAVFLVYGLLRSPISSIPGPAYSMFTGVLLKYNEFRGSRRVYIHRLHQQYGSAVRLSPNEVSFSNLEALKEIYSSNGSGYDKTEFYDLFCQYGQRTMFSTLNKADHSQMKKRFADRYAMTNVVRPGVMDGIKHHVNSTIEKCENARGGSIDVYELLHCYSLDCVTHILFSPGGTDSLNTKEGRELMEELSSDNSLPFRVLQYYSPFLSGIVERLLSAKNVPKSKDYVLRMSAQVDPGKNTLIEKLQSKRSEINYIEMAAECMDHMAAGIDTTGDGLCFLMWQLSQPQFVDVQKRLRAELLENRDVALDDLIYLDAVVKEGLRCFPPIPMSLPRYVPSGGKTINGYNLPARTIVSCQAYSLHLLNEDVFPQPKIFWPERWLEKEGALDRSRLFFSFASGGRGCIGKNLAMVEMKLLLREIFLRFSTRVSKSMKADMTMDDQIISTRPKGQICLLDFELMGAFKRDNRRD